VRGGFDDELGAGAISLSTPSTKGTPNSFASALPREFALRPASPPPRLPISPLRAVLEEEPRDDTAAEEANPHVSRESFLPEQPLAHLLYVDDETARRAHATASAPS